MVKGSSKRFRARLSRSGRSARSNESGERLEDADGYEVGVASATATLGPVAFDDVLDLIVESTASIPDAGVGCRDRREGQLIEMEQRLSSSLGTEFDVEQWRGQYRQGRDYQEDHPMSAVDHILDRAFVPQPRYTAQDMRNLATGVLDDASLKRLFRYSIRASARAIMTGQKNLADASQRSSAWTLGDMVETDQRDDMVGWAPLHVAASVTRPETEALDVLHDLAPLFPDIAQAILSFSKRSDITLAAFGWERVRLDHGVWIVSTL